MRFCELCQTLMKKSVTANGIRFVCVCGEEVPGDASDTLLFEMHVSVNEVRTENTVFLEQCCDDHAANIVPLPCECGASYLILIEVLDVTVYVCADCKRRKTHNEYFGKDRS